MEKFMPKFVFILSLLSIVSSLRTYPKRCMISMCEPSSSDFQDQNQFNVIKTKNKKDFKINLDIDRFIKYNAIALALAIGANFLGSTSFIMSHTNPDFFRNLKLDQLYSIDGFQRYIDVDNDYEVLYPNNWRIDRNVLIAKEMLREKPLTLNRSSKLPSMNPDVAFSFPDSRGKENLSILKSQVMPGFTMEGTLGTPDEAAPKLMELIAPPSSGKTYTLINAYKKQDTSTSTTPTATTTSTSSSPSPTYYVLEYRVEKGQTLNQHCVSVITAREAENSLFTLTAMSPETIWDQSKGKINTIADSFQLSTD